MARPKNKIERKAIGPNIIVEFLNKSKEINEEEGRPINRPINVSLEKYLNKKS